MKKEILCEALKEIQNYLNDYKGSKYQLEDKYILDDEFIDKKITKDLLWNLDKVSNKFVLESKIVEKYFERFLGGYIQPLGKENINLIKIEFISLISKKLINQFCKLINIPYKNEEAIFLFHFIDKFIFESFNKKEKPLSEIEENITEKWWFWLLKQYEFKKEIDLKMINLSVKKIVEKNYTKFDLIKEINKKFYKGIIPNYVFVLFVFLEEIDLDKIIRFYKSLFRLKRNIDFDFIQNGKEIVKKWFEKNNFGENFIKVIFEEKDLLFYAFSSYYKTHKNYSNEVFFLLISLIEKNEEKKASQILTEYFGVFIKNKSLDNKDEIIKMFIEKPKFELKEKISKSFFGEDSKLLKNKSYSDEEIKLFFKNELKPKIKKMLDSKNVENEIDNLEESILKINFFESVITNMCEFSKEKLEPKSEKMENYYYKLIFTYQFGESVEESIEYGNSKELVEKKSIIKDSINDLNLEKFFISKPYLKLKDLEGIDPIVFCNNNVLSTKSILKFSWMENSGDKLYNIIINDLMLNAQINWKNISYFENKDYQERLFKTIFNKEIIQSSGLFFKNKEYSLADYLEAFLFSFFEKHNYEKTKELLLNLILDCYDFDKIDEKIKYLIDDGKEYFEKKINYNSFLGKYSEKIKIEYWYEINSKEKKNECLSKASKIIDFIKNSELNTFDSYINKKPWRDEWTIRFLENDFEYDFFVRKIYSYFNENGFEKTKDELERLFNINE